MSRKTKAAEFVDEGYNIKVIGRHIDVTDAMKQYAIEKVSKIERFSTRIIEVVVKMDIQKLEHRVDIILKVDHIKIKSHSESEDMYGSIDRAVDKIQQQLRRYKTRIQNHQAKALSIVDMNVNVFRAPSEVEVLNINDEIEDENERELIERYRPHEIVSHETSPLKTLAIDEAIMKMELSGDAFLIYFSEEEHQLKVIYRRKDGNFGVIDLKEPQA